jgi:hypothetical protein
MMNGNNASSPHEIRGPVRLCSRSELVGLRGGYSTTKTKLGEIDTCFVDPQNRAGLGIEEKMDLRAKSC